MLTCRNTLSGPCSWAGRCRNSTPTCLWIWKRQSVPKRRDIKFRTRGITQKKANIIIIIIIIINIIIIHRQILHLMEAFPMCLWINKIKWKRIRQTHLVYLSVIVELTTCFDTSGSSSCLYLNQVTFKTAYTFGILQPKLCSEIHSRSSLQVSIIPFPLLFGVLALLTL